MGLLSIVGRLSLDGSGFQSTLKTAEKQADKFSSGLTKKLIGAGTGFMGFNAIKQMGLAAIDNAKEITKLSREFKLTTDQVQQLQEEATRLGKPFSDLVKDAEQLEKTLKTLDGGEVMFSDKAIRNMTIASDFIETFKAEAGKIFAGMFTGAIGFAGGVAMSPEQQAMAEILAERKRGAEQEKKAAEERIKEKESILKINEEAKGIEEKTADEDKSKAEHLNNLIEKRRKMLDEIARIPHEPGSEGEAKDRLRVAKINDLIAGLQRDGIATAKTKTFSPMSDSLTSVGNFLGANPNAETRTQLSEANRTLKSMDRKLTELKTGGSVFPL